MFGLFFLRRLSEARFVCDFVGFRDRREVGIFFGSSFIFDGEFFLSWIFGGDVFIVYFFLFFLRYIVRG